MPTAARKCLLNMLQDARNTVALMVDIVKRFGDVQNLREPVVQQIRGTSET